MIKPTIKLCAFIACIPILCGLLLLPSIFTDTPGSYSIVAAASGLDDDATPTETETETPTETQTLSETATPSTTTPTITLTPTTTPPSSQTAAPTAPVPTTPAVPIPTAGVIISPTPVRSPTIQTTLIFTWTLTVGPPTTTLIPYPTVTLYFPEKKSTPGLLSAQRPAELPEKAGLKNTRTRSSVIWSVVLLTGLWFVLVGIFLYSRKRIE